MENPESLARDSSTLSRCLFLPRIILTPLSSSPRTSSGRRVAKPDVLRGARAFASSAWERKPAAVCSFSRSSQVEYRRRSSPAGRSVVGRGVTRGRIRGEWTTPCYQLGASRLPKPTNYYIPTSAILAPNQADPLTTSRRLACVSSLSRFPVRRPQLLMAPRSKHRGT